MSWLERFGRPYFASEDEAAEWLARELPGAVPQGWEARPAETRLTWILRRNHPPPGEWHWQEYSITVARGLDLLVFTHGNKDVGPMGLRQALLNALVMDTRLLHEFGLRDCLEYLLASCKPNEWGYT